MIRQQPKITSLAIPATIGLLAVVISFLLLQTGTVMYESPGRMLTQWDAQHYLSIARDGYERFPCPGRPDNICGNVGWFPFYPLTGLPFIMLGLRADYALIAVSWLAFLAALLILFRLLQRKFSIRTATAGLVCLVLFPGSFYFLTAFPYALYLLLAVIVFDRLDQQRYGWLPLLSGALAVTYPSGIVIVLPLVWELYARRREISRREVAWLAGSIASVAGALFLYAAYYWYRFDDFFLYSTFQSQSYYAHEPTFPLIPIVNSFRDLPLDNPIPLTLLFVGIVFLVFFSRRLPAGWLLFALGVVLFTPTAGTTACYYRHVIVAFPLPIMAALAIESTSRKWLLVVYVGGCLYLTLGRLLPLYKAGLLM